MIGKPDRETAMLSMSSLLGVWPGARPADATAGRSKSVQNSANALATLGLAAGRWERHRFERFDARLDTIEAPLDAG
jgi:hypothetical protein